VYLVLLFRRPSLCDPDRSDPLIFPAIHCSVAKFYRWSLHFLCYSRPCLFFDEPSTFCERALGPTAWACDLYVQDFAATRQRLLLPVSLAISVNAPEHFRLALLRVAYGIERRLDLVDSGLCLFLLCIAWLDYPIVPFLAFGLGSI